MSVKTIGILGGGQLGRMSALAGAPLGIVSHVYCPDEGGPAAQVVGKYVQGDYEDLERLREFAQDVDVITYEFENIPLESIKFLEGLKPVYPSSAILEASQERLKEKKMLNDMGLPTTRWAAAQSAEDIKSTLQLWGASACIIKTIRFGYDGKGQAFIKNLDDVERGWAELAADIVIIEEVVDFEYEISVIVARDLIGNVGCYAPALNIHRNHILHTSTAPAPLSDEILAKAQESAIKLAERLTLVGVLGVEMFVSKTGEILINEIAPRPHNSGHWTMDACYVSQFEQHMRAVAGFELGRFDHHHRAVMTNLLGNDIESVPELLKNPDARVHHYGKSEAKEGRKMGHVTVLGAKV